jgi:hypothetical protein
MQLQIKPTTDETLDWYSNSKLVAMNTCPRWAAVRFGLGKMWAGTGRAMALEAGKAAHNAYAAMRLFELGHFQHLEDHMRFHTERIFAANAARILEHYNKHADWQTNALNFALEAYYASGFYDDPYDKRRTVSSIEEALVAYHQRYPYGTYPIWCSSMDDATQPIGIELFFDLTVTDRDSDFAARYIGTLDGLHLKSSPGLLLQENKTGSRIDDTWADAFKTSNQVTGYMMAAMAVTNIECTEAIVRGMAIPLPRTYDLGGIRDEPVERTAHQFGEWMRWFVDGVASYRAYAGDELATPMYTHSCNRYYRPCAFIPLCASDHEEQLEMIAEMDQAPPSPSEQSLLASSGD